MLWGGGENEAGDEMRVCPMRLKIHVHAPNVINHKCHTVNEKEVWLTNSYQQLLFNNFCYFL